MRQILTARENIYNEFQRSAGPNYFFKSANSDEFAACYRSMFLIADTGESLLQHRTKDFSDDPMVSYIEFWGVMQAVVIQQDAIVELHKIVVGNAPAIPNRSPWNEIRDFRNLCAGHPANRSHGVPKPQRSFMGRISRTYSSVQYELWDADTGTTTHPKVDLGTMIDAYDVQACDVLQLILATMKTKWP